jgi:hypothetical protein
MPFLENFGNFLEKSSPILTPFARRFAYGADRATALELEEERAKIGELNGTGPYDRQGALRYAARQDGSYFSPESNGPPPWLIAVGVGVLLLFFVLLGRR